MPFCEQCKYGEAWYEIDVLWVGSASGKKGEKEKGYGAGTFLWGRAAGWYAKMWGGKYSLVKKKKPPEIKEECCVDVWPWKEFRFYATGTAGGKKFKVIVAARVKVTWDLWNDPVMMWGPPDLVRDPGGRELGCSIPKSCRKNQSRSRQNFQTLTQ